MLKVFRTLGRWLGLIEAEPSQPRDSKTKPGGLEAATQAHTAPDSRRLFPDPESERRAVADKRARELVSDAIGQRPAAPLEVKVASLDNVSTLFYIGRPISLEELSPEARRLVDQGRISLHWNEAANVGIIVSEQGALHAEMAPKLVNPAYGSFSGLATEGRIVVGGTRHRSGYYRNSTRFSALPGETAEQKFLKLVPEQKASQPKLGSPSYLSPTFDPDRERPGSWSVGPTQTERKRPVEQRAKKHTWISLREPGSTDGMAEQLARYQAIMHDRGVKGF